MNKARELLETRTEEINIYFDFLFTIVDRNALLSISHPQLEKNSNENRELVPIKSSVVNTLKANGFLLLYNLVEATVKYALNAIRDHICVHGHHFDDLHNDLQHYFEAMMKDDDMRGRVKAIREKERPPLAIAIINAGFDANKIGGNIHHAELRKLSKKFGFDPGADPYLDQFSIYPLMEVKNKRNDLAHGTLAFLNCGENVTIDQIIAIKNEVIRYLETLLNNIDSYLQTKGYLAAPSATTPIVDSTQYS